MIVKMKKLTILVSEKDRNGLLIKLRNIGAVHVKNLSTPSAEEIGSVNTKVSQAKTAISILNRYKDKDATGKIAWTEQQVPLYTREIVSAYTEMRDIKRALQDISAQIEWYRPWGGFDPQRLNDLKAKGVFVRLYHLTKGTFRQLRDRKDIQIIRQEAHYIYFAQLVTDPNQTLPFEEVRPPEESYEQLSERRDTLEKRREALEVYFNSSAKGADSLVEYLSTLEKRYRFLDVMHGMKQEQAFSYMQGFCPVDKVREVAGLAKSYYFGYMVEDPNETDEVPTLIKNPRWIGLIAPVFKFMNTIPGYREYDISFWFLMFFSLFFAMLIGDAGYGLLFIIAGLFLRRKFRNMPAQVFLLIFTLSISTIIWGAVTGTWFGLEGIAQLPFLKSLVIGRIDSFIASNQTFMIYLCFVIGVIHLSLAHLIIAFKIFNSLKALAEIGWVLVLWGVFFLAGTLVLSRPFPEFAGYMLMAGSAFIILFSNPQRNILKGVLISLANLPLKIISSFSDVVSYIRLFAVGYASLIVASSFNDMAMQLGFNNILRGLGSSLILVFGHALNIILGLMAVIVHGIRLNMLEFSGQMGMEWSGKEYSPFKE